jgi:hypothetical protein
METLTVKKKKFPKNRKIRAVSLKPAYLGGDEQFRMAYVLEEGTQKEHVCTPAIFDRVNGKRDSKPGLCVALDLEFIILVDESEGATKGQVIGIHTLPKNTFQRGLSPAHLEGKTEIEIQIQASGELTVTMVPPKTNKRVVQTILGLVENLTKIQPGDMLADKHEVVSASGNILRVRPGAN